MCRLTDLCSNLRIFIYLFIYLFICFSRFQFLSVNIEFRLDLKCKIVLSLISVNFRIL